MRGRIRPCVLPTVALAALALMGTGCGGSSSSNSVTVNSAAECAKFANDTSFDANSDQDLARVGADGDPRFVTESEANAVAQGESMAEVFCRLGFYFGGLDRGAAPQGCDSEYDWAIGDPNEQPDLLSTYPTVNVCFQNGRVKRVSRGSSAA